MRAGFYKGMQSLSAFCLLGLLLAQTVSGFVLTGRLGWFNPGRAYGWHTKTLLFPFLLLAVIHIISSVRLVVYRWGWDAQYRWVDVLLLSVAVSLMLGVVLLV